MSIVRRSSYYTETRGFPLVRELIVRHHDGRFGPMTGFYWIISNPCELVCREQVYDLYHFIDGLCHSDRNLKFEPSFLCRLIFLFPEIKKLSYRTSCWLLKEVHDRSRGSRTLKVWLSRIVNAVVMWPAETNAKKRRVSVCCARRVRGDPEKERGIDSLRLVFSLSFFFLIMCILVGKLDLSVTYVAK